MQHTNQQKGSVMTFTIVGVVLTVAALGLLYGARPQHDAAVVPTEEGVQTPVAQQSTDEAKQDQKPAAEAAKPSQEASQGAQRQEQATNTPNTSQRNTSATGAAPQTNAANGTPATPAGGNNLPTTGPADDTISLLVSGVMTGVAVAYVRSRKLI